MFAASKTDSASTGGYQISRSLRFNSADNAYLNRTPASSSSRTTWTFSTWVKRSALNNYQTILSAGQSGSSVYLVALFFAENQLDLAVYGSGGAQEGRVTSTAVYRDMSAWYHVMAVVDTTNATSSNRLKLYINGSQITAFSTSSYPAQNSVYAVNSTDPHFMGTYSYGTTLNKIDGYQTETYLIDGQALTPSSFGETNAQTGVWQPKAYSGSYGTNGFYLNFSDNSNTTAATLGKDYSGNGNNWTPNNFSVTAGAGNDSLVDSPTSYGTDTGVGGTVRGNYATINPLQLIANVAVSNGNLYLQSNSNQDQFASAPSTIAARTGKWYAEFTASAVAGTPNYVFGVGRASWSPIILDGSGYYGRWWYTSEGYAYLSSNGGFYNNNSYSSTGATFASGDIIGVAMDLDAGSISFYKNGTLQGTPFTSIPLGVDYVFVGGAFTFSYPTPTNIAAFFANFGQRPFAYTAPSGFKALCTQNLPTPTIGATTATQAGKYFNTVLYTGTGSNLAVTGVGFQPDWIWTKSRSAVDNNVVVDAVRGIGNILITNNTNAESTYNAFNSFDSDGFTKSSLESVSGRTYVAWNWKANGSGSSNTAGSITSTVSANTTSGFSIITWTGNATQNATIGHGLGAKPAFFIVKNRTTGPKDWPIKFNTFSTSQYMYLNGTGAVASFGFYFPTEPTSSVIYLGSDADVNGSGASMVCYAFTEIAGYSKFGNYTGNGSTDGPFIYTGMRPAYVMVKRTDANGDWRVWDTTRETYNVMSAPLYPNDSGAEASSSVNNFDILSNGFKVRNATAAINANGGAYIYMAFASNPFKYSLAR